MHTTLCVLSSTRYRSRIDYRWISESPQVPSNSFRPVVHPPSILSMTERCRSSKTGLLWYGRKRRLRSYRNIVFIMTSPQTYDFRETQEYALWQTLCNSHGSRRSTRSVYRSLVFHGLLPSFTSVDQMERREGGRWFIGSVLTYLLKCPFHGVPSSGPPESGLS